MKDAQNISEIKLKTRDELVEETTILKEENDRLSSKILYLELEYKKLQKLIFGAKSERFKEEPKEQLKLELFPEVIEKKDFEEEEITYKRKKEVPKKKPVSTQLPLNLVRKTEIIEPENIPEGAKKIGENITEVLEYDPGKVYVRQIIRPKYVVENPIKTLDFNSDKVILTADMPNDLPLFASNAGPGFLAHLFVSKYIDHLPFYRQIQIHKRQGVVLASSTINDWFANTSKLLQPLYEVLKKKVLQSSYIQADESPIKVLTKDKPGSSHKGWMWVYHSPPDKLLFFDYRSGRSQTGPKEILIDFHGILQTDGYVVYSQFADKERVRLAACMAHARRKFFEAKEENPDICKFVLSKIGDLYDIERTMKEEEFSDKAILENRQKDSLPIMNLLEKYLIEQQNETLPKSLTGKAVSYSLSLWKRLSVFLDKPEVLIDNNLIENSIRPLALGRKNYLFAGSHAGAQRTAMMYSFFGSCKMQGIEPLAWLKSTLEKISNHKANKLHQLLPGYKE